MWVHIYGIRWAVDEHALAEIQSRTGESWTTLLSDAEYEQEELPRILYLELDVEDKPDDFYDLIKEACEAVYCICTYYEIAKEED